MLIERIYHRGLAQASYLIGCQASGAALVVDPNRDVAQYMGRAAQHGLHIAAVTETHIHADFVSGARELAACTGAALYLSAAGTPEWQYAFLAEGRPLRDGDSFAIGGVRVTALHTPGHTPEHLAFLVADGAAGEPMGVFSGDFVFVGDVGRPDLLERAAGIAGTMEAGARQLFASLGRFRALPEYLQVWPGHGAGSACGKALGAVPQSTVGYELRHNWALAHVAEGLFVREVLAGQPDPPPYFARMKRVNRDGPPPRPAIVPPALRIAQLGLAERGELLALDVRPADEFAAGHVPGVLNIPGGDDFLRWAGWLVPYGRSLALVGAADEVRRARDELLLIGLDDLAGYVTAEALAAWRAEGRALATSERRTAAELVGVVARGEALVVDVRDAEEFAAGHIPGAINIPLGHLAQRQADLPRGRALLVHCQGGYRSAVAASVLRACGWERVTDMRDGFAGWTAAGGAGER